VAETCRPLIKPLLTPHYRKESCDLTVIDKAYIIRKRIWMQHPVGNSDSNLSRNNDDHKLKKKINYAGKKLISNPDKK
jgi:hypothetical protein